jgi:hypothetical protein
MGIAEAIVHSVEATPAGMGTIGTFWPVWISSVGDRRSFCSGRKLKRNLQISFYKITNPLLI